MRSSAVALAGLTALAAALRFLAIGHQSYWFDEAHTAWLVHFPLGGMLRRLPGSETSPPLYFVLTWGWTRVFGSGEAAVRSLSAVAGVLTVPLVYATGRELFSRRVGLTCAALAACNPLLVWYSQEARSYALMVLLSTVALLAFAHLRRGPDRRWASVWALAAVLALATHYYSALAILPEGVWLWRRQRSARSTRIGVEVVVGWLAILGLLAVLQLHFLGTGSSWITYVPLLPRIGDVPKTFALGPDTLATAVLGPIALLIVAGAASACATRTEAGERRSARLVLTVAGAGFAIVAGLVALGFDQLDYRNMLALWVPVALLIAAGLGSRRAGWIGVAATAALCAVGLTAVGAVAAEGRLQRPDWRGVARVIGPGPARAVLVVNGCQSLPLTLYLPGLHAAAEGVVKEIDVIRASRQTSWYVVLSSGWFVTCHPSRPHPVVLPARIGSFQALRGAMRVNQFSIVRLRSKRPALVTARTFARAGFRGELMFEPASSRAPATP